MRIGFVIILVEVVVLLSLLSDDIIKLSVGFVWVFLNGCKKEGFYMGICTVLCDVVKQ